MARRAHAGRGRGAAEAVPQEHRGLAGLGPSALRLGARSGMGVTRRRAVPQWRGRRGRRGSRRQRQARLAEESPSSARSSAVPGWSVVFTRCKTRARVCARAGECACVRVRTCVSACVCNPPDIRNAPNCFSSAAARRALVEQRFGKSFQERPSRRRGLRGWLSGWPARRHRGSAARRKGSRVGPLRTPLALLNTTNDTASCFGGSTGFDSRRMTPPSPRAWAVLNAHAV